MSFASNMIRNSLKRVTADNTTLFLCDIQEGFRNVIHNMPAVIANGEFLNNACNILNVPAVITEHYPKALGSTCKELVQHPTTKIYSKTFFSMMIPELKADLAASSRKQVRIFDVSVCLLILLFFVLLPQIILCGIESHVCVLQTTLDLLQDEYDVFIVCDAVSSQR
jgi:isochorismate hydrolase